MQRDIRIDYLKGIACLLMLMAHVPLFAGADLVARQLHYFAGFATVLFFALSGYNAYQQAQRYSLKLLFQLNMAIFIFGTAYSVIIHPDLYQRYLIEILQIIALGSFLVALCQQWLGNKPWVFALLAVAIMGVKLLRDFFWPDFHGAGLLFTHADYTPHYLLTGDTKRFFPGFVLLPWLYTFFWGVFVFSLAQSRQLAVCLLAAGLFAADHYLGWPGDHREKWDMSLAYWLLSVSFLSGFAFIVRALPDAVLERPQVVHFFGQHSLLFLFMHAFGIVVAFLLRGYGQYVAWLMAFLVSWGAMWLVVRWRGLPMFKSMTAWWIMAALILVLPALILVAPALTTPAFLLVFTIGVLFAKHYGQLRILLRDRAAASSKANSA